MSLLFNFLSGATKTDFFTVWASGDSHPVREDITYSYKSLQTALSDIDAENWDIGINVGDFWNTNVETEAGGEEIVNQFSNGLSVHNREDIYCIGGNHDGQDDDEPNGANWLFKRYIDPEGTQPAFSGVVNANRPYQINGTYENYYLDVGNIRFLFMTDRQDGEPPMGEKGLASSPTPDVWRLSGGVSLSTWQWLHDQVLKNPDKIIIISFHQAIYETTIGSGFQEFSNYGVLSRIDEESDYRGSFSYYDNALHNDEIIHFLDAVNGSIDMWLSGHLHHRIGDSYNGRGTYVYKHGIHHKNVCQLTKNLQPTGAKPLTVHSYFLDFYQNQIIQRAYIHFDNDSVYSKGFNTDFDASYNINKIFTKSYITPTITAPTTQVTGAAISNEQSDSLDLSWNTNSTGVVIARWAVGDPVFTPVDGTTYYRDEPATSGAVIFQGTASSFTDYGRSSGTTYYYKIYTYNAGGDQIKYNTTSPISINGTTL